jgi:hypothetical protein
MKGKKKGEEKLKDEGRRMKDEGCSRSFSMIR